MSFGNPSNPYGQEPPRPENPPGTTPPDPSPYGYPQAPPTPGFLGGPMEMPGLMKTARVLLFILAGFQLLGGIFVGLAVGVAQDTSNVIGSGSSTDSLAGVGILIAVLVVGVGALSIFLGVRLAKGGNGIRVTTIVYASLLLLSSLINIFGGNGGSATFLGLIALAMGGIILASLVNRAASAWFNRPRY